MPGLFGFVDIHTCSLEDHFLEKMMAPLVHFHWYHTDFLPQKGVGVGSVSLSENICIKNKDNILVGYHGDIYDVVDDCDKQLLTRGNIDSIAIIKLYKRYGERLPEKLNGSFNIFIYDGENNTSYLFNDRFGYEHLYLYKDANVFLFSPEVKAFLVYDKFENSLDPHGISDYFVYSY